MKPSFEFYQLFEAESSTFTYLLIDRVTRQAVIIDPVKETLERDLKLLSELEAKLDYILDTHVHADHITSAGLMRERTGAKIALSREAQIEGVDLELNDGDQVRFGNSAIKVITTPGHTNTCLSFYAEDRVFTGDALLIRGCGRTDFQQGAPETLFHSVREKLFKLADETIVYPAHDYKGMTSSTIGTEKKYNPRLKLSLTVDDFAKIMGELNLSYPKKIKEALPANQRLGLA